jgi:hypothetical protein
MNPKIKLLIITLIFSLLGLGGYLLNSKFRNSKNNSNDEVKSSDANLNIFKTDLYTISYPESYIASTRNDKEKLLTFVKDVRVKDKSKSNVLILDLTTQDLVSRDVNEAQCNEIAQEIKRIESFNKLVGYEFKDKVNYKGCYTKTVSTTEEGILYIESLSAVNERSEQKIDSFTISISYWENTSVDEILDLKQSLESFKLN